MRPVGSNDIIDKYFADPNAQAIISEIEQVRIKAYNTKRNYYKKYGPILLVLYLCIGFGLYSYFQSFGSSEEFGEVLIFLIIAPGGLFIAIGKSKQTSLLEEKKVITKLFNHFIKFIFPSAQFNEDDSLYNGNPMDSRLFINDKKENSQSNSTTVEKTICNSIFMPLLYTTENQVSVSLEGVEIKIEQEKGKKTITDMGILYKINFKNPKRIISTSVKVIPNSNSRFKTKDELVLLEHQEFEKYFDVYSADPVEARMILTPNVMDKLAQLMTSIGGSYSFNFFNNMFYIKNTLYNDTGGVMDYNPKNGKGTQSVFHVDRDNSIQENSIIYRNFYDEIMNIQQLVDALNVDYFNKLS